MMSLFFSGISSTVLLYTMEDLVCLRVVLHFVSAVVRVKCVAFSVAPHFGSRRRICSRSIPLRMSLGIVMDILFWRQRTNTPFADEKKCRRFLIRADHPSTRVRLYRGRFARNLWVHLHANYSQLSSRIFFR